MIKHNALEQYEKIENVNPKDIVYTPIHIAEKIVKLFDIKGKVLEPFKGEGAFLKVLPKDSEWCEIREGVDFFKFNKKVDWIVSNPPYSIFSDVLKHSLEISDNIVYIIPFSMMFNTIGRLCSISDYGGIVSIYYSQARTFGFDFGYPCGIFYLKRGYAGKTLIRNFNKPKEVSVLQ